MQAGKLISDEHGNRVLEHRRVLAKHLGRELTRSELVLHLNGDRFDNRLENLQIVSASAHARKHSTATSGAKPFHEKPREVLTKCESCGMPIVRRGKIARRFCDDSCRATWHRARRLMGEDALRRQEALRPFRPAR